MFCRFRPTLQLRSSALTLGCLLLAALPGACQTTVEFFPEVAVLDVDNSGGTGSQEEPPGGSGGQAQELGGAAGAMPTEEPAPVVFELNTDASCPDDISFTDDLLEVVFDSDDFTMSTSQRSNLLSPWSFGVAVPGLAIAGEDTGGEISRDGLSLWWSSRRPDHANGFDLWFARRTTRDSAWGTATRINELSTAGLDGFPTLTEDQLFMVFLSHDPDSGFDFYSSTRESLSSPWQPRVSLTSVNSPDGEGMPHLSADGLTLYFSSNRPGGQGANDLYIAQRASRADDFSPPTPLTALNTEADEGDAWVSSSGDFFVFTRSNAGTDCLLLSVSR